MTDQLPDVETLVPSGCSDPVVTLCRRQAVVIRNLEVRLERYKTINDELNRARISINKQIRKLRSNKK